mgnify:CR=1 FL=1|jgi:hypothetical protein
MISKKNEFNLYYIAGFKVAGFKMMKKFNVLLQLHPIGSSNYTDCQPFNIELLRT